MHKDKIIHVLEKLSTRHPLLISAIDDIKKAFDLLVNCYENKHKLLVCGNGGSAADAEHIVGELMKSFTQIRILPETIQKNLKAASQDKGAYLATKLQPALTAISLTCHTSLNTAIANDVDPHLTFAQQVIGYGDKGDVLLGISTSGNAQNVLNALITAKSLGLETIGLSGKSAGRIKKYCDVIIAVEGSATAEIQELHLPVYHALCNMLELKFFSSETENI